VTFTLSDARLAQLDLLDLQGRTIERRTVGGRDGRQVAEFGNDRPLAPGLFWVRLSQAGHSVTRRVAVVR